MIGCWCCSSWWWSASRYRSVDRSVDRLLTGDVAVASCWYDDDRVDVDLRLNLFCRCDLLRSFIDLLHSASDVVDVGICWYLLRWRRPVGWPDRTMFQSEWRGRRASWTFNLLPCRWSFLMIVTLILFWVDDVDLMISVMMLIVGDSQWLIMWPWPMTGQWYPALLWSFTILITDRRWCRWWSDRTSWYLIGSRPVDRSMIVLLLPVCWYCWPVGDRCGRWCWSAVGDRSVIARCVGSVTGCCQADRYSVMLMLWAMPVMLMTGDDLMLDRWWYRYLSFCLLLIWWSRPDARMTWLNDIQWYSIMMISQTNDNQWPWPMMSVDRPVLIGQSMVINVSDDGDRRSVMTGRIQDNTCCPLTASRYCQYLFLVHLLSFRLYITSVWRQLIGDVDRSMFGVDDDDRVDVDQLLFGSFTFYLNLNDNDEIDRRMASRSWWPIDIQSWPIDIDWSLPVAPYRCDWSDENFVESWAFWWK